jgi:two-component system invasion response regulator UvrY
MNELDVALVDDHHLVRAGVAVMVNTLGGFRVALEAAHGRELVERLRERARAGMPPPAIAIVDLNMPVMDGYATLQWLRTNEPAIRALALTFDGGDDAMVRAARCGARGFILKNARPDQLKAALDDLVTTGYHYTDEVSDALQRDGHRMRLSEAHVHELLTPREREFILHVCSENEPTYDEIAALMGIHRRSVDNHRASVFTKFHIKSKTGLVLFAMRYGLVK